MKDKVVRHRLIRSLLQEERIGNQEQLRKALRARGVRAQQATLSRDLHELGVVKGPAGYALPGPGTSMPSSNGSALEAVVGQYLTALDSSGNLIVLHTGPGRAQAFALELDNAHLDGAMGTIAGDDTIFIAARTSSHARRLARRLKKIAGMA